MTSNALFDMLDIDETAGIDPTDVTAIKNALTRIKVVAATVAKDNDAPTTLAILCEMERRLRSVTGVHSTDELGQALAQDSTGSPAKALPGGTSTMSPEDTALNTIMASTTLPVGVKMAIQRMITPGAPDYIKVEDDGTSMQVATLTATVNRLTAEKDAAVTELAEEKDPKKKGSLAEQLAAAKASATGADQAQVNTIADELAAVANVARKSKTAGENTVLPNVTLAGFKAISTRLTALKS